MTQKLLQLAGPFRTPIVIGVVLRSIEMLFASLPLLFLYLVVKATFDNTLTQTRSALLVVGLVICLCIQAFFYFQAYKQAMLTPYRLGNYLRLHIAEKLRKLPMGFFARTTSGKLSTIFLHDIQVIEGTASHIFPLFVGNIGLPIFVALMLLWVDWRLALAMLITAPLAYILFVWTDKIAQRLANRKLNAITRMNNGLIEYIQGISVLKAFNFAGQRSTELRQQIAQVRYQNVQTSVLLGPAGNVVGGILEFGFAGILVLGTYFLTNQTITPGTLILFLIISTGFYKPLYQVSSFITPLRNMEACIDRLNELLHAAQPLPEPAVDTHLGNDYNITFREVSFQYDDTLVLDRVSLNIPARSLTALVGASGSGKSTIFNLIARFWDVQHGNILIGGTPIKEIKLDTLLANITMVSQDIYLFQDTIANNIKLGKSDASMDEVMSVAQAAQCHEFIMHLPQGYETIVGEGGATLSGGEKQRIAIARAILKNAPIVLLDEATASIDPENEALLQAAFNALVKDKTVVVIAHRLHTIVGADQIIVLESGRVVGVGKHTKLLVDNLPYASLWKNYQRC